ncbi:division/outer membrane stress-associated lipid-binding lipoprotein [Thalassotalea profundi]|uniref:BON domain-containing protein n=1 Tax=Thalassotalea profundi TaxID=2036687 RepID=A0ABQ3IFR4_9GAMM|nr:division/outer membrane stress-associated lipid-binding lipoprotein [Thalassotalea profundi]GHE81938.1 BON domain-containing protein [Thalassotalea profundi]
MKLSKSIVVLATAAILQGCMAAAVVGVVGGAAIATDNRTIGTQINDQQLELEAHSALRKVEGLSDNTNLQVVSLNGSVLVVGQATNAYLKELAIKTIEKINGVQQIHNQIRISNLTAITTRSNDVWITSKVKTAIFKSNSLDASNVKVITENGEVFLMGLVKKQDGDKAVEIARNVGGVNRVFKMFEYISE